MNRSNSDILDYTVRFFRHGARLKKIYGLIYQFLIKVVMVVVTMWFLPSWNEAEGDCLYRGDFIMSWEEQI